MIAIRCGGNILTFDSSELPGVRMKKGTDLKALIALSIVSVRIAPGRGGDSMRAQDFPGWLAAIAGLSAEQRGEAVLALAKAGEWRGPSPAVVKI